MLVKTLHVTCAILTIGGFTLRGYWMLRASPLLNNTWVKVVPHIIDTLLLGAGIWLAINIAQYPGTHAWLTAKVLGLLAYIVLGTIALKRGKTKKIRVTAWIAATLVFLYIVWVALNRSPLPV
jgi:uncharacterized membrane protein SirB2